MRISDWSSDVCSSDLHKLDLLVIDKKAEIASLGKIDLRGEESGAPHLIRFASGRQQRQRRGERRSRHAIADSMNVRNLQPIEHRIDGIQDRKSVVKG